MADCCYCTDPKGDILCEKCADEIYDRDTDIDDGEALQFGATVVALALAIGMILGYAWGYAAATML